MNAAQKEYVEAVESGTKGMEGVSTGPCPGCEECASNYGYCCIHSYNAAYEAGEITPEPGFSWSACDICGSTLGGDREEWHWYDREENAVGHGDNACVDCVLFLANGDLPERPFE